MTNAHKTNSCYRVLCSSYNQCPHLPFFLSLEPENYNPYRWYWLRNTKRKRSAYNLVPYVATSNV